MGFFNKGVLNAYSEIDTKYLKARTLVLTGSCNVGGNLFISGSISASGGSLGLGDMLKSVYDTSNHGYVDNSDKLDGLHMSEVRTHAPASHSGSHTSGSADAISIYASQIIDFNNVAMTVPRLAVTGSSISSISGSLIVTGSISGSSYYGPIIRVRTGSVTTFAHRGINVVNGGSMIITMAEDLVNDEVTVTLQSTGSGGGTGLADTVIGGLSYGLNSGAGTAGTVSRSDHTHGTPSLSANNALDVGASALSGSINTGSRVDHIHRGVLSFANSGSADMYSRVYLTGSTGIIATQGAGQVITLTTDPINLAAQNITATTLLSGADYRGPTATIATINATSVLSTYVSGSTISGSTYSGSTAVLTNVIATNVTGSTILSGANIYGANLIATSISGSTISGSHLGATAVFTSLTAANITGSTIISGADHRGPTATITSINTTNLTGSTVSGSTIYGATATITTVTATNLSGSNISGSSVTAPVATLTNVIVTNLTGSGVISGSTVYASTFSPANITTTNLTGSANISGSTVYANNFSGSGNLTVLGTITGSLYTGPVVAVRTGSGATTYARRRLNFVNGGGMAISLSDDAANQEIQVSLTASPSGITPSDSVTSELTFGQAAVAGSSASLSRGDHTHGTPSLDATNPQDIGTAASAGVVNTGSRSDHVHRGVGAIGYSGSASLYGTVYVTGSTNVTITQGVNSLAVSLPTSITLTNVTGSTLISGSSVRGATALITDITATHVTGSLMSGSDFRGPTATIAAINATNVTGSTVSGSVMYTPSLIATTVTGSILSGSNLYSPNAVITTLNTTNFTTTSFSATNISGSNQISTSTMLASTGSFVAAVNSATISANTLLSGADIRGPTATITSVTATNITGSSISGSNIFAPTGAIVNFYPTNITGSGTLSGSIVRASDFSGSHIGITGNAVVNGNLSGSTISGSITMNMDGNARVTVRKNTGGAGYTRRRINFIEGTNVSFTVGDDVGNEEVDVTVSSSITGSQLQLNQYPVSNSGSDGLKITGIAGETLATFNAVYVKSTDGKFWKADCSTGSKMPIIAMATSALAAGATGSFLLQGTMRVDAWAYGTGSVFYGSTAGQLSTTAPTGSGNIVQTVGVALSSTTILFNPSYNMLTLT